VTNNLFGLSYFDSSTVIGDMPPVGHVGCAAEITESQLLPDGRSNILSIGLIRYRVESYVESESPYLLARLTFFEDDDEEESALLEKSREVAQNFSRIARAVRTINDERASLPDISDTEPQRLSFLVSAALEIEPDVKQELLELSSTSERLKRLRDMLSRAVTSYEERARIHLLARGNGHSGTKIDLE
jgi:Lon protease-like protein